MGAATANVPASEQWFKGEDRTLQFDVVNAAGSPQTMTGWALTYELKASQTATTALISKTAGSGIAIGDGDGTDDRATVSIASGDYGSVSFAHEKKTFYHRLYRTDSGNKIVLAEGEAVIHQVGL